MKYQDLILISSLFLGFIPLAHATPLTPVATIKKDKSIIRNIASLKDREVHSILENTNKNNQESRLMNNLLSQTAAPTPTKKVNSFFKTLFS